MVEFIDNQEEQTDAFSQYLDENIVPLVEAENKIKIKYRNMFWGYLFTILFLVSVSILMILFVALMSKDKVSAPWQQLIFFNAIIISFIYVPIYLYKQKPKNDIFDVFLKFYGNWKHLQNSEVKLVHSPVIPKHEEVGASHDIIGEFDDTTIEIRDTFYTVKSKKISSGVVIYVTFPIKFKGSLLMFDRRGFYRKKEFPNFEYYNNKTNIPAANYFNIFTSNDEIGETLIHSLFLEYLLDLQDVYDAGYLYLQAEDNYMRIYLEGSELYINNYKLWSKMVDKKRFLQMHNELEKTYLFIQTVKSLMENK